MEWKMKMHFEELPTGGCSEWKPPWELSEGKYQSIQELYEWG